jgi:hypothetical protein
MQAVITKTTALFPSRIFLQWDLIDPSESGVYVVDVERSEAPEGPWLTIAHALSNAFHYVDDLLLNLPADQVSKEGLNLFSVQRNVYYRVIVTPPSGRNNAVTSDARSIEPGLDKNARLLKRKILRDETVAFQRLNGIELMVLKKKHWGYRCTDCFDPVTKDIILEHCSNCYGTGFVEGYATPIKIRGRIAPQPTQTQISPHGMLETTHTRLTVLDYPELEPGDLVVDLRRNDRYVVKQVTPTTLKTVTVHQVATVSLLARDAVEYEIKVDPYTSPSLY